MDPSLPRTRSNKIILVITFLLFYFVPIATTLFFPVSIFKVSSDLSTPILMCVSNLAYFGYYAYKNTPRSNIAIIIGQLIPYSVNLFILYTSTGFTSIEYSLVTEGFTILAVCLLSGAISQFVELVYVAILMFALGLFFVHEGYLSLHNLTANPLRMHYTVFYYFASVISMVISHLFFQREQNRIDS